MVQRDLGSMSRMLLKLSAEVATLRKQVQEMQGARAEVATLRKQVQEVQGGLPSTACMGLDGFVRLFLEDSEAEGEE